MDMLAPYWKEILPGIAQEMIADSKEEAEIEGSGNLLIKKDSAAYKEKVTPETIVLAECEFDGVQFVVCES